ncbi:MAG: DUF2807 domain-containing protein [Bacteroidota bacterium]
MERLTEFRKSVYLRKQALNIYLGFHFYFVMNALIITLISSSCTLEQLDDCFTNAGKQVIEDRTAKAFTKIELYDNINLVLLPGKTPQIRVEGGENILESVKTDFDNDTLVIRNTMKCNWTRSYNRELTVYASITALKEISYEGSGDIKSSGQLSMDSLKVNIWGGAGTFEIDVDINKLNLSLHYGTVDLHIRGKSMITTIIAGSYGPFYCNDLISNIVYISNGGSNDCYVNAVHILEAGVFSTGNIYYTGDPYKLKSIITGSGRLIKVD